MNQLTLFIILLTSSPVLAFDYFGNPIDYWKEKKPPDKVESPPAQKVASKPEIKPDPVPPSPGKFDWSKFKDPKNPEFFKEGEHTPPEPFMELARNPTDENIQQWFALIEAKNKLMGELQKRIGDYVAKNSPPLANEEKELIQKQQASLKPQTVDFKRFRFRLYFESSCPHCKNMLQTLKQLQDMGYYVEARQIDDKQADYPIPFSVVHATAVELKERKINSWPVMFVADTAKELIYRIDGYFPTQNVLATLANR